MIDRYDPWGQTPRFLHHRPYFFYLRSHRDLANDDEATDAAVELFGVEPDLIAPDGDYNTFANGFVSRLWSDRTAETLADMWSDQLSKFEAWAIHDGFGDIVESIGHGPTETALAAARLQLPAATPITQAFIVFHASEHEPPSRFDPEAATDHIRGQWPGAAQGAFHFRNGRVLFVANKSPVSIVARRMETKISRIAKPGRPLRKEVHEIALYDGADNDGIAYYDGGTAWRKTRIYDDDVSVWEDEAFGNG